MAYWLEANAKKVHCLLFDYGQRHVQELGFAKYHCRKLGFPFTTITLPKLHGSSLTGGRGSVVVPNRNAVLLSVAVSFAVANGFSTVTYGCNKGDAEMFPDCRPEFVEAMNESVKAAGYPVVIRAPFMRTAKWEIIALGNEMGVPWKQTWSCYRGGLKPCRKCPACEKNIEAWETFRK